MPHECSDREHRDDDYDCESDEPRVAAAALDDDWIAL